MLRLKPGLYGIRLFACLLKFTVLSILTNAWSFYSTLACLTTLWGSSLLVKFTCMTRNFSLELQQLPSTLWNVIDTQLWSLCLHGINTMGSWVPSGNNSNSPPHSNIKRQWRWTGPFDTALHTVEEAAPAPLAIFHTYAAGAVCTHTQPTTARPNLNSTSRPQQSTYSSPNTQQHNATKAVSTTRGVRPIYLLSRWPGFEVYCTVTHWELECSMFCQVYRTDFC